MTDIIDLWEEELEAEAKAIDEQAKKQRGNSDMAIALLIQATTITAMLDALERAKMRKDEENAEQ